MWESHAGTDHTDTCDVSVVPRPFTTHVVLFDGRMHGKHCFSGVVRMEAGLHMVAEEMGSDAKVGGRYRLCPQRPPRSAIH